MTIHKYRILVYEEEEVKFTLVCTRRINLYFLFEKEGDYFTVLRVYRHKNMSRTQLLFETSVWIRDNKLRVSKPYTRYERDGEEYLVVGARKSFYLKSRVRRARESILYVDFEVTDKCPEDNGMVIACDKRSLVYLVENCPPIRVNLSESYPISHGVNWKELL